jgi:hypothetical protein
MRSDCIAGADAFLFGAFVAEIGVSDDAFYVFRIVFAKRCPVSIFPELLRPFVSDGILQQIVPIDV